LTTVITTISAIVPSLGFATLENILYVAKGGLAVAVLRAFSSVPGHACMGAIMGSYVARGRFSGKRNHPIWIGLLAAFLLHGLYDFPLFAIRGLADKMPQREILVLSFSVFF
jgi:RsiW-degrading membrane proteinase PrsW (M82 family)